MDYGQPPSGREISIGDESSSCDLGEGPSSSSFEVDSTSPEPTGLWPRAKHVIVRYVLQLDGSPHSIALGVFIGFVIGMTPTIGLQMVSYLALSAVIGANRISGLIPVWVSNPITAVPLYYFNWRVGVFVMTGSLDGTGKSQDELAALIENAPGQDLPFFERITSGEFWSLLFDLFVALGIELWVGCIVVGLVTGVFGYWATYKGVIAYRRHVEAAR